MLAVQRTTSLGCTKLGVSVMESKVPMVVLCVSFVHVYVTLNPSSSGSKTSTLQLNEVSVCTEEEGDMAILLNVGA